MAKVFTRIGKEIAISVKESGPNPEANPRLRMAIQNAKAANMPKDNVERAIKKASSKDQEDLAAALADRLPAQHHNFLTALPLSLAVGDYFFVHAGVRPGIALSKQRAKDLLWIREEFLGYEGNFGKVVVHGHTPVSKPEIRNNRINIDTGAFASGNLTCAVFEEDQILFL
jgi:diadenosine tetraphosphatase ApaH/serine/threonine PP2A family protein phosphatase